MKENKTNIVVNNLAHRINEDAPKTPYLRCDKIS